MGVEGWELVVDSLGVRLIAIAVVSGWRSRLDQVLVVLKAGADAYSHCNDAVQVVRKFSGLEFILDSLG